MSHQLEDLLDAATAFQVYNELGKQIEKIDTVLHTFEEQNLSHTESYETLEHRRARFAKMRGILNDSVHPDLNEKTRIDDLIQTGNPTNKETTFET